MAPVQVLAVFTRTQIGNMVFVPRAGQADDISRQPAAMAPTGRKNSRQGLRRPSQTQAALLVGYSSKKKCQLLNPVDTPLVYEQNRLSPFVCSPSIPFNLSFSAPEAKGFSHNVCFTGCQRESCTPTPPSAYIIQKQGPRMGS